MKLLKGFFSTIFSLLIIAASIYLIIKYLDVLLKPYYILRQKIDEMIDKACLVPRVQVEMDDVEQEPSGI